MFYLKDVIIKTCLMENKHRNVEDKEEKNFPVFSGREGRHTLSVNHCGTSQVWAHERGQIEMCFECVILPPGDACTAVWKRCVRVASCASDEARDILCSPWLVVVM